MRTGKCISIAACFCHWRKNNKGKCDVFFWLFFSQVRVINAELWDLNSTILRKESHIHNSDIFSQLCVYILQFWLYNPQLWENVRNWLNYSQLRVYISQFWHYNSQLRVLSRKQVRTARYFFLKNLLNCKKYKYLNKYNLKTLFLYKMRLMNTTKMFVKHD